VPVQAMIEAIRDGLREEMERDESVVILGEDVGLKGGVFRATQGLFNAFGEWRVRDAPIAETGIAAVAIGMAAAGLRPVAEFQFADYSLPAFDQIANEAATIRFRSNGVWGCPIVFRAPFGGGVHGGLYHSQNPEAYYAHIPGLYVVAPATAADAKGLLKAAIRCPDPVFFFEHKRLYRGARDEVEENCEPIPLGVARLDREGEDVSVITYGMGVHMTREVADALAPEGISIEILDLRTLVPYDKEAIQRTVEKTGKVLVFHEANKTMGLGAEVSAYISEDLFRLLDAPVVRLAAKDSHSPYAPPLEAAYLPSREELIARLRELAQF
jgi:2-oxoisovalerate dehydrogenase E1 component beta subunit